MSRSGGVSAGALPELRPSETATQIQIGEVAARTGLSLRTIRYYEDVGLLTPAARTKGGFRLYSEADMARLQLLQQMKPLEWRLEEMGDLLGVLTSLAANPSSHERAALLERLVHYREAIDRRIDQMVDHLEQVTAFRDRLEADGNGPG
ncbi:MerR family DNA-binding transcriptional regulator [Gephyromycinifex aptenodytis]|uniref:MerR family DNA-binding transcriptional regulator n=1 Tax=Gephyromycinifex aptenodytis TaxID=2716227 RepID=UPI001445857C|nr:MerR family DNA-binding transcriptional regulator [Gephyromycinifex aptenodytis]